ncbi:hypothetical protein [uncultured Flavobacterium sp.]|uniref:hypothetical protein n=1 Tax=uncultured Flavobacterium sp. TaxID=165435 RepID=UPI00308130F9
MKYYTYWSISDLPTNIRSFEVFFWVAIVSFILWVLIKKFKKNNDDYEKIILLWTTGIFFSLSVSMFLYLKFFIKDTTDERIQNVFNSQNVLVVEGLISDFERQIQFKKMGSITTESFVVDSIQFRYNDVLLGQFNHFGKTKNGIFRDHLPVKITYAKENHEIIKIEIAK